MGIADVIHALRKEGRMVTGVSAREGTKRQRKGTPRDDMQLAPVTLGRINESAVDGKTASVLRPVIGFAVPPCPQIGDSAQSFESPGHPCTSAGLCAEN